MSDERTPPHITLLADNLLKVVIAALVGILTWIGTGLQQQVSNLELAVSSIKIEFAEIKTDLKYLRGKQ